MGLDYSFELYVHNVDVEKALLATAEIAWTQPHESTNFLLPNGRIITLPFECSDKNDPVDLARNKGSICISLLFDEDEKITEYLPSDWDFRVFRINRTYLRLGCIFLSLEFGKHYTRLAFTAATSGMSLLFLESEVIKSRFLELLRSINGVLGLINIESYEYPLLEDPKLMVSADYTAFPPIAELENELDQFVQNILKVKQAQAILWKRQKDPPTFFDKWVEPFYQSFTDGGIFAAEKFVQLPEDQQTEFADQVQASLKNINDEIIELLLADNNWRYKLVGVYFVGFGRLQQFTGAVGTLFLQYAYSNATLGCCFALTRLNSAEAIGYLESYLSDNLQVHKLNWNEWLWERLKVDTALASLIHLDKQNSTNRANKFLKQNGEWEHFLSQGLETILNNAQYHVAFNRHRDWPQQLREKWKSRWNLQLAQERLEAVLDFTEMHFD